MFSFAWPWVFALAPLPLLIRWLSRKRDSMGNALRVPFYSRIQELQKEGKLKSYGTRTKAFLLLLVWLALLAASARPIWIGDPVPLPQQGRDLLMAVDISQSMSEPDMAVNSGYASRIDAVKVVVSDFIERRDGDRIGLILFGEQGYLQTPLTFDRDTVQAQLTEAQLGFAGNATAIGDAIGLAIKRLRERDANSRVLVLLTDGANTAGTNPREAANIAAEAGIRIHTVGIGAEARPVSGIFGLSRTINPSSDLDEETLEYIATTTGGQYFRARDPVELANIYDLLDQLEPVPEDVTYRPQRALFYWPLSLALALSIALMLAAYVSGGRRESV
jgi:Ca-activated chloride channel family protein